MFRIVLALVGVMLTIALVFKMMDAWRISPARGIFMLVAAIMFVGALGYMMVFSRWSIAVLNGTRGRAPIVPKAHIAGDFEPPETLRTACRLLVELKTYQPCSIARAGTWRGRGVGRAEPGGHGGMAFYACSAG